MGKRLTANEETQLLQDTIRAGHELLQALKAATAEARSLAPGLTAQFEAHADTEIKSLANHLTQNANEAAESLNREVDRCRQEIIDQLTISELVYDKSGDSLRIQFKGTRFDDSQPLPYPGITPRRETP